MTNSTSCYNEAKTIHVGTQRVADHEQKLDLSPLSLPIIIPRVHLVPLMPRQTIQRPTSSDSGSGVSASMSIVGLLNPKEIGDPDENDSGSTEILGRKEDRSPRKDCQGDDSSFRRAGMIDVVPQQHINYTCHTDDKDLDCVPLLYKRHVAYRAQGNGDKGKRRKSSRYEDSESSFQKRGLSCSVKSCPSKAVGFKVE
jgi:hypothetical protein